MLPQDKIITIEDWVESFWKVQEEDFRYFQEITTNFNFLDPEEVLKNIKERMKTRKIFYQIYKYLPKHEIDMNSSFYLQERINQIIHREELITEMINKILDLLSTLIGIESSALNLVEVKKETPIVH